MTDEHNRSSSSRIRRENLPDGSPPTGHRLSLVENVQNESERHENDECHHKLTISTYFSLTLHSLGIIFGDIGTSPLYVLDTIFSNKKKLPSEYQCIGAVSLIIWSLILVVSIKYAIFILQADNKGEGGIFALCALLTGKQSQLNHRSKTVVNIISILSASFLIGDGALTPAVSVLSAVEGLALNAPNLHQWIVPITVAIIFCLFFCQQWGTSKIGNTFGPLMLLWFSSLFSVGIWRIRLKPSILRSFNPYQAIHYLIREKKVGFYHIGGVFLSVTGCEALFADLGHFGLWPVRTSWFFVVFPSVVVNYLGQGALLIHHPESVENPFYRSLPEWFHWPMVILATIATIIASQAIITGCFSLLSQAGSLGFCPPLHVEHTSETMFGQIYVPTINWTLMCLTIFMTVYFKSSSRLTNAYGLTVCSDSVITTILYITVLRSVWKKHLIFVILFSLFLIIDFLFWSANAMKFLDGAWIAILISLIFFFIGLSWYYGQTRLKNHLRIQLITAKLNDLPMRFGLKSQREKSIFVVNNPQFDIQNISSSEDEEEDEQIVSTISVVTNMSLSCEQNVNEIEIENLPSGTSASVTPCVGCFLTHNRRHTPHVFENYIRLLHSIPKMIIFLRIQYARIPFVKKEKRLLIKLYGHIYHISATFGYAETKNKSVYSDILLLAKELYQIPIPINENEITFFISNQTIFISKINVYSLFTRWPLYIYSIEKSLINRESVLVKINPKNTIQIGIIVEL